MRVAGTPITRLCANFSEAEPGEFFAVEGSTGYIEIALNQASAADRLNLASGAEIEVESDSANY
jgi:S-adenosylmethionine hydrolase